MSKNEARLRVLALYKAWHRQIPFIVEEYDIVVIRLVRIGLDGPGRHCLLVEQGAVPHLQHVVLEFVDCADVETVR